MIHTQNQGLAIRSGLRSASALAPSLMISFGLLCLSPLALGPLSAAPAPAPAPAQAQTQAARLAVFELGGGYGSITERQRWSSYARAEALAQLRGSGVRVIDRDDFVQLLPPERSLEDCAGQCSAQLAREVGAHWALSGSLERGPEALHLGFRLHSASGELLAVAQRSLPKQPSELTLASEIRALSAEALEPISARPRPSAAPLRPQINPQPSPQLSPQPSSQTEALAPSEVEAPAPSELELGALAWWRVKSAEGARCLSEPLRHADYLSCVEEGACAATPTRDGCQGPRGAALSCVDLSQVMSYLRWRAQRDDRAYQLPSLTELKLLKSLSAQAPHGRVKMEWLRGPNSPTQALSRAALRRAPKVKVARHEHGARSLTTRPYPPAFQLPELGFRLSYPEPRAQACGAPRL